MEQNNNDRQNVKPKVFNCLIDSIGINDTLRIYYLTQGCFQSYTEELRIYIKSDSLFADLTVSLPYKKELLQPLTQYLSDSLILAYAEFEKKGRSLKTSDGCTTSEQYIIYVKAYSFGFEDNGCAFEGYSILKNKIFGKTKINSFYEKIFR